MMFSLFFTAAGRVHQLTSKVRLKPESECYIKSVRALCYFKMPLCGPNDAQGAPTAQRLCRQECQELFHVCQNDIMGKFNTAWPR